MKFYVQKAESKKGQTYVALICDLGYRQIFLSNPHENSWSLCAEILGISVAELKDMENGKYEV